MMNQGYGYGYGGGIGVGAILFLIFGALVVAGIVVLIIWAVRSSHGHGSATAGTGPGAAPSAGPSVGHDEAIAIAKRRLATGEINKEQYDEIMTALGG